MDLLIRCFRLPHRRESEVFYQWGKRGNAIRFHPNCRHPGKSCNRRCCWPMTTKPALLGPKEKERIVRPTLKLVRVSCLSLGVLIALATAFPNGTVLAEVIYVDNFQGDDAFDGSTATPINPTDGPVKTIRRGLQLLRPGGSLSIANQGLPYYESMEIVGGKLSGGPLSPLVIEGNGAELNGSFPVPSTGWRNVGENLWQFTPFRKGSYLLIQDNKALPEIILPPNTRMLPEIPEGQWAAWKGSIYLRTSSLEVPAELNLWFAVRSMGVTLYEVHDVVVRNLKVRHFRMDGFNAHDRCKNVVLENITAEENGRTGVTAAGTSFITLQKPVIQNNGRHSVLITEKAGVQIDDETNVAPKPTLAE